MHIQHEDDGRRGRFFITESGQDVAERDYTMQGDKQMIINHTEVDASLEGKGVGKALVSAGADYARQNSITVVPLCPFAKKVMEHDTAYADVLSKS